MAPATESPIPLRDGPTVPESVVLWLLTAADRGLRLTLRPTGRFGVEPQPALGSEDDRFCRAHRDTIARLLAYSERVDTWPLDRIGTPWTPQAVEPPPAAPAAPPAPPASPVTPAVSAARSEPEPVPLWSRES